MANSRFLFPSATIAVAFGFFSGRISPAFAETLTIELDTLGEAQPAYLCVVAKMIEGAPFQSCLESKEAADSQKYLASQVDTGAQACLAPQTEANACVRAAAKKKEGGEQDLPDKNLEIAEGCYQVPEEVASPDQGWKVRCTRNSSLGSLKASGLDERTVFLRVKDVGVADEYLAGNIIRIAFHTTKQNVGKGRIPVIGVDGGSYHQQEAMAFPLNGDNLSTRLVLRPRCVSRPVSLPRYDCLNVDAAKGETATVAFAAEENGDLRELSCQAKAATCTIPLPKAGSTTATARTCLGDPTDASNSPQFYQFDARIETLPVAERIDLRPTQFGFKWEPNCLSPAGKCPEVRSSAGLTCRKLKDAPFSETEDPNKQKYCMYSCTGSADFPVQVRFTVKEGSVSQFWDEVVSYPGQILRGYIPPEQRRVAFQWSWPTNEEQQGTSIGDLEDEKDCDKLSDEPSRQCCECRKGVLADNKPKECQAKQEPVKLKISQAESDECLKKVEACKKCRPTLPDERRYERARQAGSEIDYLEVRTPEGRIHNVGLGTNQIRVPELECRDQLTLTYKGRLTYNPEHREYDSATEGVAISHPDSLLKPRVLFSAVLGGGVNIMPSQGRGKLLPAGEAAAIVVSPWGRPGLFGSVRRWDLRASAILSGHRYCSALGEQKASEPCSDTRSNIPYWRLFLEPGVRWQWRKGLQGEFSAGVGHSFYFYERDGGKFQSGPLDGLLFSLRAAIGYELFRGIALLFQLRMVYPEFVYATAFDERGMASHAETHKLNLPFTIPLGLVVRFDDIF